MSFFYSKEHPYPQKREVLNEKLKTVAVDLLHTPNFTKFLKPQKKIGSKKIIILHRIKRNEMMAAHENVIIANIRIKNQPIVVPTPVGRLIIFDTETTRLGAWDRIMEIGAVELINENTQPRIAG